MGTAETSVPALSKVGRGKKQLVPPTFRHYDTGNCLSDKICIYFTNVDVIYYCLQNFVWTNQTIIDFIHELSHVLIDSSVKSKPNVLTISR